MEELNERELNKLYCIMGVGVRIGEESRISFEGDSLLVEIVGECEDPLGRVASDFVDALNQVSEGKLVYEEGYVLHGDDELYSVTSKGNSVRISPVGDKIIGSSLKDHLKDHETYSLSSLLRAYKLNLEASREAMLF